MAKKRTNTCLIGCGVGCLVLLIVAIALFAGGAVWIRGLLGGFEEAVESRLEVEKRFGEPGEFTPAPDGAIAAARLETFLAVREAMAAQRADLRAAFEALPLDEDEARELDEKPFGEKMGAVLGITSSAFGLAGRIGDFFQARNDALVEHGMGLGEYSYIYALTYYSWLGKSPADGPGDENAEGSFQESFSRVRRDLIAQLENQLAAIDEAAGGTAEAAPGSWRETLAAEIETMRRKAFRVPWEDDLPPAIAQSLAPFRDRLEASYDPVTNPFELSRMQRRNSFSFEAD